MNDHVTASSTMDVTQGMRSARTRGDDAVDGKGATRIGRFAATFLIGACSSAGWTQSVQAPLGPLERAGPRFDPVGIRAGAFALQPRADATLEYNDNLLATRGDKEGDVILRLRPRLNVEAMIRGNPVALDAYLSQSLHAKRTSENALEAGGRLSGAFDITRRSSLRLLASYDALAENRFSITSASGVASRVRFTRAVQNASYAHGFGDLRTTVEAQFSQLDFSDARTASGEEFDQDFRDTKYYGGTLSAAYPVFPGGFAVVRANADRLDQARGRGPDPLDRDSTGMKIEAGFGVEVNRLLVGEFRIGYLRRNAVDDRLRDARGLSFGGNLVWSVTPLTTVRFDADRTVEEGGSRITAGNLRSQGELSVEHELLRWVILEASARFAVIQPLGFVSNAKEYEYQVGATYFMSRRLRLVGSLSRYQRDGNSFSRSFTQNRALLSVMLGF